MTDWDDAERRVEKAHELYERGRWEEAVAEPKAAMAITPYNLREAKSQTWPTCESCGRLLFVE